MCTVMILPETLTARLTPSSVARKQVDDLIRRESEAISRFQREKRDRNALPPIPAGNIYVWLDRACYGNGGRGFYYVRFHSGRSWGSTAYDRPVLIVQKSKLRPDQIAFMERKCRETEAEAQQKPEQSEFDFRLE